MSALPWKSPNDLLDLRNSLLLDWNVKYVHMGFLTLERSKILHVSVVLSTRRHVNARCTSTGGG